jgi:LysR family transcriptional regulator, glycine cleavage system transcriptional activator
LSFTRAADLLGVTASAASLQIRALEQYLGRALFRRNGRNVHLTDDGAALLPRVQQSLEALERAVDDTRADRYGGQLRVTTLASFLHQWLLPRLPRFHQANPQIDLHFHTDVQVVDFVREDLHVALRLGAGNWSNVHAEKLFEEWLLPVCTPALLERNGPIRCNEDLSRYPLLHSTSEPWTFWMFGGRVEQNAGASWGGLQFDDSISVVRAAVAGHGLALARWSLVAEEIGRGALVSAAATPIRFERSYWFVCPPRARGLETVESFRQWTRAEAAKFPLPPQGAVSPGGGRRARTP